MSRPKTPADPLLDPLDFPGCTVYIDKFIPREEGQKKFAVRSYFGVVSLDATFFRIITNNENIFFM